MNSLKQLNTYSDTSLEFTDYRPAELVYRLAPAIDVDLALTEGETHYLPLKYRIDDIIQPDTLNVIITIDLSAAPGSILTFDPSLDGIIDVTEVDDVWTIDGVDRPNIYALLANTQIQLPRDFVAPISYNVAVTTDLDFGFDYDVSLSITDLSEISGTSSFIYEPSTSNLITDYPQITDLENPPTDPYTIVISQWPSLSSFGILSSAGTGGTSTWDAVNKTLTITGTKIEVNSHLAAITFDADAGLNQFKLRYQLTNDESGLVSIVDQHLIDSSSSIFLPGEPDYYDEDTVLLIEGNPVVLDTGASGVGPYTVVVAQITANTITLLSSAGTLGGTSVWNAVDKTLTITGTRDQVNSHLDSISMTPFNDLNSDFVLSYTLTTPTDTVVRLQDLLIGATSEEVSNITITRPFIQNTPGTLFASDVPQIIDIGTVTTYQVRFDAIESSGGFTLPGGYPVSTRIYSGTKSYINNTVLPTVEFWPRRDLTGAQSFRYRQYADGNLQVDVTVNLSGTDRTTPLDGQTTYTFTANGTHTPSNYQRWYLKFDALVVGGGAGGYNVSGGFQMGGAAGGVLYVEDHPVSSSSFTVAVGNGGAGYTSSSIVSSVGGDSYISGGSTNIGTYYDQFNLAEHPATCSNLPSTITVKLEARGGSTTYSSDGAWRQYPGQWYLGSLIFAPFWDSTEPCYNYLPNPSYFFEHTDSYTDPTGIAIHNKGSVATSGDLPGSAAALDFYWVIDEKRYYIWSWGGAFDVWTPYIPQNRSIAGPGCAGMPIRNTGVPTTPNGAYDTGGPGRTFDISGTSTTYAAGGRLTTGANPTGYLNPGSGGQAGSAGKKGIVIIKYHS